MLLTRHVELENGDTNVKNACDIVKGDFPHVFPQPPIGHCKLLLAITTQLLICNLQLFLDSQITEKTVNGTFNVKGTSMA
jgi:hypothetical protein